MDALDRELVRILAQNARAPVKELAGRLRLSRGTVQNRITKLVATGQIRRFTVDIGTSLDRNAVRAIMMIRTGLRQADTVCRALHKNANVVKVYGTNGKWDLIVEICSDDLSEFDRTLELLRCLEGIEATETNLLITRG